jgi:hypothetical protein
MKGFRNRRDFEQWARDQFNKYGIKQPDLYTEQDLIDLNPDVPVDFINQHASER